MDFARIFSKVASLVVRIAVSVLVFYYSIGYVGVLTSYLMAQHIAPGQMPEGRFYVVFVPGGEDGAPFDSADFRDLAKHKGSYLMPRDHDRFEWKGRRSGIETYTVLERTATEQLIEVEHFSSGDAYWCRYRATSDKVVPVYSRLMPYAYGLIDFPMACLLTALSWQLTGWMHRRVMRNS